MAPHRLHEHEIVLILDFGSQYSHLIARRIRELKVYCELVSCLTPIDAIKAKKPKALILSGGPSSVYEEEAPHADAGIWSLGIPILGICYGLQEMTRALGGEVSPGTKREFGRAELDVIEPGQLFADLPTKLEVWMSHGDKVTQLPHDFHDVAISPNSEHAAVACPAKRLYGIQFHPEVTHTPLGSKIIENFIRGVVGLTGDWSMRSYVEEAVEKIREQVGEDGIVIGAVSGGVDSSVAAVLLNKAIGKRFHAYLIDNGVLRQDESAEVVERLRDHMGIDLKVVDAADLFLDRLKGVTDPEQKRKIIGTTFIDVFEVEAKKIGKVDFLLQGTLYPDVIESVSFRGPSAVIKSHHNVGGLPAKMNLKLIEPLRELFKDEVRALGINMGIDESSVYRHPFPGPGLAIRVLGEVTREQLAILRKADVIWLEEIRRVPGLYRQIGQAFAALLPVKSVGVMGDSRTYDQVVALRAVQTTDFMTADWYWMPQEVLQRASNRIINEVRGVNRVVYDISSKPPSTIEWE
mmetsp:Transcript_32368/g.52327  ORF Transcript_32368/g.52327 Transcript_32368/m.52327 type:complete len:521 (+) Transcript_32368:99-1661(+)